MKFRHGHLVLEPVVRRELQMAFYRANSSGSRSTRSQIRDIAEVGVGNTHVRISVARNVECVEGIEAEAHRLLLGNVEVLEGREVDVEIAGTTHIAVPCSAKGIGCR